MTRKSVFVGVELCKKNNQIVQRGTDKQSIPLTLTNSQPSKHTSNELKKKPTNTQKTIHRQYKQNKCKQNYPAAVITI